MKNKEGEIPAKVNGVQKIKKHVIDDDHGIVLHTLSVLYLTFIWAMCKMPPYCIPIINSPDDGKQILSHLGNHDSSRNHDTSPHLIGILGHELHSKDTFYEVIL